ncbi:MAG: chemotaxis protein CheB [Sediminibacterium sp.]|nr:chemotaxis protein CheB [Sediminibacterium sp.]
MERFKVIVIGGSAGSFQVVTRILAALPANFNIPVVLCLHRLKHIRSGFEEVLNKKSTLKVIEPEDKTKLQKGYVYLAPANYHLYAEINGTLSLSTEESVSFSRPSIDLTFDTFSYVYKNKMLGIILSGANRDGLNGCILAKARGTTLIAQSLEEAEIQTMPESIIQQQLPTYILKTEDIIKKIIALNKL